MKKYLKRRKRIQSWTNLEEEEQEGDAVGVVFCLKKEMAGGGWRDSDGGGAEAEKCEKKKGEKEEREFY